MKCSQCGIDLPENQIDESHDVPCYIFKGINRKEKKAQADKYGRRWLCKNCHENYEEALRINLIVTAQKFAKDYFGKERDTNTTSN